MLVQSPDSLLALCAYRKHDWDQFFHGFVRSHGRIMERLALFLAGVTITACSAASKPTSAPLSCVSTDSCGCAILVSGGSCSSGTAHFFHDLADGSPLQFNLGQGPATAISTEAQTNTFSAGAGDSWTETYRYKGGSIKIRYTPGTSTCPKQGEQCEYFDVRAQVLFSSPAGVRHYSGLGKCGC